MKPSELMDRYELTVGQTGLVYRLVEMVVESAVVVSEEDLDKVRKGVNAELEAYFDEIIRNRNERDEKRFDAQDAKTWRFA